MASRSHLTGLLSCSLLFVLSMGACSKSEERASPVTGEARQLSIYTVNYPLAYFAERLASEGTRVELPTPRGVDPAFWNPSPDDIGRYQSADLVLLNGAGYARWTRYATLPSSRTVVTASGCRKSFLPSEEPLQHRHGPEGEHAHGNTASTTWLDMRLATCQAASVREALLALRPEDTEAIKARFAGLERDLSALDDRLRKAGSALGGAALLASHPVYQYLSDAYGMRIESLHFEPNQALSADDLRALDARRTEHAATLMLWEAAPLPATERQLREMGVTVVVFDPVAQRPAHGNFLDAMSANVGRLACATGSEACR